MTLRTNTGRFALTAVALPLAPALEQLDLDGNPAASQPAKATVQAALDARSA